MNTQTAKVKMTNDLLLTADPGLLSSSFIWPYDTISDSNLFDGLASVGINGLSYLSGRTQFIQMKT